MFKHIYVIGPTFFRHFCYRFTYMGTKLHTERMFHYSVLQLD